MDVTQHLLVRIAPVMCAEMMVGQCSGRRPDENHARLGCVDSDETRQRHRCAFSLDMASTTGGSAAAHSNLKPASRTSETSLDRRGRPVDARATYALIQRNAHSRSRTAQNHRGEDAQTTARLSATSTAVTTPPG